jgi:putative phosphoribosyl transferase
MSLANELKGGRHMQFRDRGEAGRMLAGKLMKYAGRSDVVVLALPRGGVPVAYEVARELHAPLDVFLVRKLGLPGHAELAIGAIAGDGVRVLNKAVIRALHISSETIAAVCAEERAELKRRERIYRGERPALPLHDRTVILIDDGLATGSSMRAAVVAVRRRKPDRIVVAVPVGATGTCAEFENHVDEVFCIGTPEPFIAVGLWYGDFSQTTDQEVQQLLQSAAELYAVV